MIIFDLTCANQHRFEGWFQSQGNFELQLERGLVACPSCGSVDIRRVPSPIHLSKSSTSSAPPAKAKDASPSAAISPQGEMLGAYQKLISAVIASSEDVGAEFADEARRIHYNEAPARSIRGQASDEDCQSLRDEGIEVMRLPVAKKEELS